MPIKLITEKDYQFLSAQKDWRFWHQYAISSDNKLIYGEIGRIGDDIFVMYSGAKNSKKDYEKFWKENDILVEKYVQTKGKTQS